MTHPGAPSAPTSGPWPVDAFMVRPLRHAVLRPHQPEAEAVYPADDHPLTLHLAAFDGNRVVAAGSMFPEHGWRIRGMATAPEHRGKGHGGRVLEGLLRGAAERGGGRVWCNARTAVSGFYERHGFAVEGDPFEIEGLGPHVVMARTVEAAVPAGGFDLGDARLILGRTPAVLEAWVGDLPGSLVRTPEGPGLWSVHDVVGHLVHGESTDWIRRVEHVLGPENDRPFEPFERLAMRRLHGAEPTDALLERFAALRRWSLERLDALGVGTDALDREGVHPDFGPVTLRQLLAAWVGHDLTHVSQVARILAKGIASDVGPWAAYLRIVRE